MRSYLAVILILVSVLVCAGVCEDQVETGEEAMQTEEARLSVGMGLGVTEKPYRGMDTSYYPIPLINYTKGNFYFRGTQAGLDIYREGPFEVSLIGQGRMEGYEPGDSDSLNGMDDREMSVDGGIRGSLRTGFGKIELMWVHDVLSEHLGNELSLSYSKTFRNVLSDSLAVTPKVGMSLRDNHLNNYYYGVEADEAIAGRGEYKTGGGYNYFSGVNMRYRIDEKWSLIGAVSYTVLSDEIRSSPIVDQDYIVSGLIGAMYSF